MSDTKQGGARAAGERTRTNAETDDPTRSGATDRGPTPQVGQAGRQDEDGSRPPVRVGNRPGVDAVKDQREGDEDRPPPGTKRPESTEVVLGAEDVTVKYAGTPAVVGVTMNVYRNEISALIGPSGCGKSTLLRCFNRMNDLIPVAKVEGKVTYHGEDIYDSDVDPVEVRRRVGMVFQAPNPFPKTIYDNIAYGPTVLGMDVDMDDLVESTLRRAALWSEVKGKLKQNAYGLSGGQQQRLCIARAIATSPDVILMDEPCSSLDPVSTGRIEDLMRELTDDYTIVIVTHNMQQAARISDRTAFFTTEVENEETDERHGILVEYDLTDKIFSEPADTRTEQYVSGRFG